MKDLFGKDTNRNMEPKDNNNMDKDKNRNMGSMGNSNMDKDALYRDEVGLTDMQTKDKVLVGIFETEDEAVNVIRRLKEIGYSEDKITVIAKDKEKMDRLDDKTDIDTKTLGDSSKVGEGAAIGGALGGIAAALPALGLLAIPGIGPILAAGPIAAIMTGVVAGGVAGGLVGALAELGVSKEDAKEYENQIQQGKIVILVENRDEYSDDVYSTYNQYNTLTGDRNRHI